MTTTKIENSTHQLSAAVNVRKIWDGLIINAKTYGAKGDGTDDYIHIQAAIDACEDAGGGTVVLPAGSYKTSDTLTIKATGVHLVGVGREATRLYGSSNSVSLILIGGMDNADVFRCSVKEMTMDTCNIGVEISIRTAQCLIEDVNFASVTQAVVIHGDYTTNPRRDAINHSLSRLEIEGASGIAIEIYHCGDIYLEEIQTPSLNTTTGYGVVIDSGVTALYASRLNITGGIGGILIRDERGISPNPTGKITRPQQLYFNQCLGDTTQQFGIQIEAGDQITFVDSWGCGAQVGNGIVIGDGTDSCHQIAFVAPRVIGNAKHGMKVVSGNTNLRLQVSDGHFISNGTSAADTYNGIEIEAVTKHVTLTGNHCYNDTVQGYGTNQKYGINLETGDSDYIIIQSNNLHGNATGGIFDGSTGTNKQVGNNLTS